MDIFMEKFESLMEEEIEEAINFCLEEIKKKNNPDFYVYLGEGYMANEDYNLAVHIIKNALDKGCTNKILALSLLGEGLFYLEKYEESKEVFNELLKYQEHSFFAFVYLIDIETIRKKYNEAERLGEEILLINKLNNEDSAFIYSKLAWIRLKYLNKDRQAYDNLQNAIRLDKECGTSYVALGYYFLKNNEYEKAIENYEKSLFLGEDFDEIYEGLEKAKSKLRNK